MLVSIQSGYFNPPSFADIKRFVEWSGENFEWMLVLGLFVWLGFSSWNDNRITKMVVEQPQRNDFFFVDYLAIDDNANKSLIRHPF